MVIPGSPGMDKATGRGVQGIFPSQDVKSERNLALLASFYWRELANKKRAEGI